MTTDARVTSPVPQAGIGQAELVDFGALLVQQGVAPEVVAHVRQRLQEIATEAAFKGAAEMALTVERVRLDEAARWRGYTDGVLRTLRALVLGGGSLLGYVSRDTVLSAIDAQITTAEAAVQAPRQIPAQSRRQ